jgi:GH24 family phage-related lysozyme (muramidase)
LAIPHDQLMASLQPAQQMGEKLLPLSDHAVGLDRMRARQETLASLGAANLSAGLLSRRLTRSRHCRRIMTRMRRSRLIGYGAGMQPAALSLAGSAPTNAPGQVPQTTKAPRALSQMRTDPAWQKEMKQREGGFIPRVYDPTRKGDYTIGFGHHIASQAELSSNRGRAISQNEGEALFQHDLAAAEDAVRRHIIQPLTQNQFDALADFVFQAGQGNFTKSDIYIYTNLGDYPAAQRAFPNTNAATKGASNRRVVEAKKFGAP